jgi:predicted transcriptional regulator
MNSTKRVIPIRLDTPTRERLDRLARRLDRPLVREAIAELLAKYDRKTAP